MASEDIDALSLDELKCQLISARKVKKRHKKDLYRTAVELEQLQVLLEEEQIENETNLLVAQRLKRDLQRILLTKALSSGKENKEKSLPEDNFTVSSFFERIEDSVTQECSEEKVYEYFDLPGCLNNNDTPSWTIIPMGRIKVASYQILCDGLGHAYRLDRVTRRGALEWVCRITTCKGKVHQIGNGMQRLTEHYCKPRPGLETYYWLKSIKAQMALDHRFEDPVKLMKPVFIDLVKKGSWSMLPSMHHGARTVIMMRMKDLPLNPKDLSFKLHMDYIPDEFLKGDIIVGKQRHLIFATENQIKLLGIAKRWYLDTTHTMVFSPFFQRLVINVCVLKGRRVKIFPLAMILMSRAKAKDYKAVFDKLLEILEHGVHVKEIVCDYQEALWQSVQVCFSFAKISGCGYHWFMDVFRAIKMFNLGHLFQNNEKLNKLLLRLLSLFLLPPNKIPKLFDILKKKSSALGLGVQAVLLTKLFSYVEITWITNSPWTVSTWSMYREPQRSFYELNMWLKCMGGSSRIKNVYWLVYVSYQKFTSIPSDLEILGRKGFLEVTRYTCKNTIMCAINNLWDEYEMNNMNALKLLKNCALLWKIPKYYDNSRTWKIDSHPDDIKLRRI